MKILGLIYQELKTYYKEADRKEILIYSILSMSAAVLLIKYCGIIGIHLIIFYFSISLICVARVMFSEKSITQIFLSLLFALFTSSVVFGLYYLLNVIIWK